MIKKKSMVVPPLQKNFKNQQWHIVQQIVNKILADIFPILCLAYPG